MFCFTLHSPSLIGDVITTGIHDYDEASFLSDATDS